MTKRLVSFYRGFVFFCMILCGTFVFSQEQILLAYQQNFIRASLSAKPGILRDAATDYRSGEFIGILYEFALQYALDYSEFLRDDPDMIILTAAAARGAGISGNRASSETLWKVFLAYRDPYSRVEVLSALVNLGKDEKIINNLNDFFIGQNNSFRNGAVLDYTTLSACISALGAFGEASSFPALLSGLSAGYTQRINDEIQIAMESLQGDFRQSIIDIIKMNHPADKLAAFRLGTESEKFKASDPGQFAGIALETALDYVPGQNEGRAEIDLLKFSAIRIITDLKWNRAAPLVISHFYKTMDDYLNGDAPKERFLEAIACLGVMANSESAVTLALQLGYYNSVMEYNAEYDTDIIMEIVRALGEIGDKLAFDYILYISYLNYPEQIQSAAREALDRLRW
jgi:hypothetical protein